MNEREIAIKNQKFKLSLSEDIEVEFTLQQLNDLEERGIDGFRIMAAKLIELNEKVVRCRRHLICKI